MRATASLGSRPLTLIKNCCSNESPGWPAGSAGSPIISENSSINKCHLSPWETKMCKCADFIALPVHGSDCPLTVNFSTADASSNPQSLNWSGNIREKFFNQDIVPTGGKKGSGAESSMLGKTFSYLVGDVTLRKDRVELTGCHWTER